MSDINMEVTNVKNILVDLNKDSHISATEWGNGEGFDVEVCDKAGMQRIGFEHKQWAILKKIVKKLLKEEVEGSLTEAIATANGAAKEEKKQPKKKKKE